MSIFTDMFGGADIRLCPHCMTKEDDGKPFVATVAMTALLADEDEVVKSMENYTCVLCGAGFKSSSQTLDTEDVMYILLLASDREKLREAARKYMEYKQTKLKEG